MKLEDITPGMELKGTVLNVVPFGAFVDVGLKESGLVHISQMANRYIKSPYDVVAVGDVITVWVMEVKPGEKKISLSMIQPGQERRQGGRFGGAPRGQGQEPQAPRQQPAGDRPQFQPRGDRPPVPQRSDRPGFQRGGQGQGARFGRSSGGPPRTATAPLGEAPAGTPQQSAPVQPPPRPRLPGKPKPLPNLTAEKKSGKAALNTFAELAAFFKKEEPKLEQPVEEPKPAIPPESQSLAEPKPEPAVEEPKPTEGQPPA